jgi:hypothetical protein
MSDFTQRAIIAALEQRVAHQSPGVQWSIDNATNWTATCMVCGDALKGTHKAVSNPCAGGLCQHDCACKQPTRVTP